MRQSRGLAVVVTVVAAMLLGGAPSSQAQQVIRFDTDPFAGSTALTDPGRQVVGGELVTTFDPATDVFVFDAAAFGAYGITSLSFLNGTAAAIPASGVNTIVLQTAPVPFTAGLAANAIAAQVTAPGAGFFVYFNSSLGMARLVFSTDLSVETADLKVLAQLTNISGESGRDALATFTAANFALEATTVPEPSSVLLLASGLLVMGAGWRMRRRRGPGTTTRADGRLD